MLKVWFYSVSSYMHYSLHVGDILHAEKQMQLYCWSAAVPPTCFPSRDYKYLIDLSQRDVYFTCMFPIILLEYHKHTNNIFKGLYLKFIPGVLPKASWSFVWKYPTIAATLGSFCYPQVQFKL
jgi:hypothetical protein